MSRPQRNRSGANKSRPQAAKRPAGQQGGGHASAKPAMAPTGKPTGKPTDEPAPLSRPAPADEPASTRSGWVAEAPLGVVLAAFFGLFVLGLLVGAGGALVHNMKVVAGGTTLPTGTVLAVLTAGGVSFCGGVLTRSRLGAVAPAAGWLICGLILSQPRPEGDLLIGGQAMDYGFLVGGLALLLAVCALPYRLLDVYAAADAAEPSR